MTIGPEHPDHPGYQGRPEEPQGRQWPQYEPAPQQYGGPYGAPYQPPQAQPMHPQATTALVLGILGLAGTFVCGLPIVLGPFAWVLGARAKREIQAQPGRYRGLGESTTGMILGIITTVLLVLAIIAVVLFIVLVVAVADSSSPTYSNV